MSLFILTMTSALSLLGNTYIDGENYKRSVSLEGVDLVQEISHQGLFYVSEIFKQGYSLGQFKTTEVNTSVPTGFENAADDFQARRIQIDEFFSRITKETQNRRALLGEPVSLLARNETPTTAPTTTTAASAPDLNFGVKASPKEWLAYEDCLAKSIEKTRAFGMPASEKNKLLCQADLPKALPFAEIDSAAQPFATLWAEDLLSLSSDLRPLYIELSTPFLDPQLNADLKPGAKLAWAYFRSELIFRQPDTQILDSKKELGSWIRQFLVKAKQNNKLTDAQAAALSAYWKTRKLPL